MLNGWGFRVLLACGLAASLGTGGAWAQVGSLNTDADASLHAGANASAQRPSGPAAAPQADVNAAPSPLVSTSPPLTASPAPAADAAPSPVLNTSPSQPASPAPTPAADVNAAPSPALNTSPLRTASPAPAVNAAPSPVVNTSPPRTASPAPAADVNFGRAAVADTSPPRTANPSPASPANANSNRPAVANLSVPPPANAPIAQPAAVQAVHLDHPNIITTAELQSGATTINLYGIEGLSGEAVEDLRGFLASTDGQLTCQARDATGSVCLLKDGTDIAQVVLVNGAARTKADAPQSYQEQEAAAQAARRGIWVNLPPPPETVIHPMVVDTASLAVGGKTYPLAGLDGLGQPYVSQLQGYIAANGDSLSCAPQGHTGSYICLMADGTDIAKVALVNGAARVAPDAPDSYRVQQADALNNRRGFWLNATPAVMTAALAAQPEAYAFVAGDDGVDGITYVGGAPMALIGGEMVFLVYGDDAGWGYYDHWHHWYRAPDRYRAHMEHFHPYGHGLHGYGHDDAYRRDAAYRHDEAIHHDEAMHRDAAYHREEAVRHDAARGREEAVRHDPGMRSAQARPGTMARPAGGGFVHPGAAASAGGFHPGGMAAMPHAAPAMHATASASGKHR